MKKIFGLAVASAAAVALTSCGSTYEIALVTDGNAAGVEDKSFMQGAWNGIQNYVKDNDKDSKYYEPISSGGTVTDEAILSAIDMAVRSGAEVIVTPGYTFETATYTAANKYKDVSFILLDAVPSDGTNSVADLSNVSSISYAEDEAGFLAGYAAVESGFRKLGYMGGVASGPVTRFGNGFIAGAEAAAIDMKLETDSVEVKFEYLGGFAPSNGITITANAWYANDTEVIFVAAGGAGSSVMAAADNSNKYVIGVDVNQRDDSDSVIYSATKNLAGSVENALTDFYSNSGNDYFGKVSYLDIDADGVALEGGWDRVPSTGVYSGYSDEKYNNACSVLKNGTHDSLLVNSSNDTYRDNWNTSGHLVKLV